MRKTIRQKSMRDKNDLSVYFLCDVHMRLPHCEKKEETLTEKIKKSLDERHTQTHGSLTETF